MYGCVGGHEEIVRILIDIGPNVEFYIEIDCTPLIKATSAGHINIAKVLLEHKNGISTWSNIFEKMFEKTPWLVLMDTEMVRLLLETGTDQEHKFHEVHMLLSRQQ